MAGGFFVFEDVHDQRIRNFVFTGGTRIRLGGGNEDARGPAAQSPASAGGREHLHSAGSGRRICAPGDALFDREGLFGDAAAGAKGFSSWENPFSFAARGHQLQRQIGAELIVHKNQEALDAGANPFALGTQKCCGLLKTKSLLDALAEGGFDAAFGGARRDEEKSRAKERIYSFRDSLGQWDPKNQRPELWNIFNSRLDKGESIRVFPLSNWTELDVWLYIHVEKIPIVPLYFAKERDVVLRNGSIVVIDHPAQLLPGEKTQRLKCRMRSLGCVPCTGAIRSDADSVPKIIEEMVSFRRSERENRAIDHDEEGSMELKKREGYF